ncbi:hypothetical protein BVI1335_70077 [Burkholderia vietnamiensis]|nr:hypothetical protein BVI1335_70077 [Burkholderia vietnamiensis]
MRHAQARPFDQRGCVMTVATHIAANRLRTFIERNIYLGARSAGADPRSAYLMARQTQRAEERRAARVPRHSWY